VDRRSWLPEDLRAYHRGLLLRLLADDGPATRRQLAQRSGLSIPTTASIVSELLTGGYVTESMPADRTTGRGPRASLIAIVRHGHAVVGVDVSGTRVRLGLCDLSGLVSEVVTVPMDRHAGPDEVLETAVAAAAPLVHSAGRRLLGFGVSVPGPVDHEGRKLLLSLALNWRDVPVAERFERAYGKTATVEYNVRAMARAETRYGLGPRTGNLLFMHLGESLGVAYMVEGNDFRQGTHGVSELGHHQVADGPRCACGGVGCLEAVLGKEYLQRRIADAARDSPVLAELAAGTHQPLEILDGANHAGDPAGMVIAQDVVNHLSTAVALSINVFSPGRIVLGGALASCPKDLLGRLRDATLCKVSPILRGEVTIDLATIGRYPGVLGGGTVALDRLFYRDQPPTPAGRGSRRVPPPWAQAAAARSTG
jgi:predicted NBD/HSP70 family sugar kinase